MQVIATFMYRAMSFTFIVILEDLVEDLVEDLGENLVEDLVEKIVDDSVEKLVEFFDSILLVEDLF